MNLKQYLLEHGVKSKETAEYLIRRRLVLVNKHPITNPDIPVDERDEIKILSEHLDVPGSFWKLKEIQDKTKLIQTGDFILDIESKDGGFPIFARKTGAEVTVIGMGDLEFLKKYNVDFKKRNIMEINPKKFFTTKFDIMINELRLDVMKSFQISEKFLNVLGTRGKLLLFLSTKGRSKDDVKEISERILVGYGFEPVEYFGDKKGLYVYAKKF